jgi:tRNA/tmRNA/rRNA uracil-C5-methylase (TrmA/RlmC/RlmD family)
MPMCTPDCECHWCVVGHMTELDQFKEKVDQLVNQFKTTPEFQTIQERNQRLRLIHMDD